MKYCLAIDIGASSGRHIVGWWDNGTLMTREIYRFPNGIITQDGHLIWDMESLLENVVEGIRQTFLEYKDISSLSIDTWGVDYVLLKGEQEIWPCYAYRDSRTENSIPEVHRQIPFEELYSRTGIQFQTYNTIYQLYDDKMNGRLEGVTDTLMIPEYLMYKLCGVKAREYTEATTGGMVSAKTGQFDMEIVERLGLPRHLFPKLSQPGTVLGDLLPEIAQKVGGNCSVVLCATHDTGSAVEGIPMEGNHPFISSGTWSLLGVKIPAPITSEKAFRVNYANEGGVGYIRFLKNIMGMWLVNQLRNELCPDTSFPEIVKMAEESDCRIIVDANAQAFMAPESMKAAFDEASNGRLESVADYFSCAYRSLANSYRDALINLEAITGNSYDKLYIVGGGAKNQFLNHLTEEATGKKVIALPIEATALGNLKVQLDV